MIEGVDIPVLEIEFESDGEIIISFFENSSFLPHSPMSTFKVELKDLINKCLNVTTENEPSKFSNLKIKLFLSLMNVMFLVMGFRI